MEPSSYTGRPNSVKRQPKKALELISSIPVMPFLCLGSFLIVQNLPLILSEIYSLPLWCTLLDIPIKTLRSAIRILERYLNIAKGNSIPYILEDDLSVTIRWMKYGVSSVNVTRNEIKAGERKNIHTQAESQEWKWVC